jgi:hypothetical protein
MLAAAVLPASIQLRTNCCKRSVSINGRFQSHGSAMIQAAFHEFPPEADSVKPANSGLDHGPLAFRNVVPADGLHRFPNGSQLRR